MCFIFSCCDRSTPEDWEVYRGDDGRNAWSALDAINKNNVSRLKVAWTYRTGDNIGNSTIECNPIIIDKILFGISPKLKAFALDAATGKQLWIFNPFEGDSLQGGVSRGLTYWKDGEDERIFLCAAYRMIALDAKTGNQLMDFGENGYVDLRKGLRNDKEVEKYFIQNTSPGVIYKDLIIVGSSMGEIYFGLPDFIKKEIEKYTYGKIHTPPSTQGIIQLPGFRGGGEWSGAAVDDKGIMYIGTHNIANVVQLVELEDENQCELLKMHGKQYVVIAAGGGGFQVTKSGDYYICFALP